MNMSQGHKEKLTALMSNCFKRIESTIKPCMLHDRNTSAILRFSDQFKWQCDFNRVSKIGAVNSFYRYDRVLRSSFKILFIPIELSIDAYAR